MQDIDAFVMLLGYVAAFIILVFLLIRFHRSLPAFVKVVGWGIAVVMVLAPIALPQLTMQSGRTASKSTDSTAEMPDATQEEPIARAPDDRTGAVNRPRSRDTDRGPDQKALDGLAEDLTATREPASRAPAGTDTPRSLSLDRGSEASEEEMAPALNGDPAAGARNEAFDTVGIFFGTDRVREDRAEGEVTRVAFGTGRARKLTLGQAEVTIPKEAHQRGMVERPWELTIIGITIYREEEDPAKHFTISKIGVMSEDEFISGVNSRLASSSLYRDHALVFVHGYNVAFDSALYRTAQIVYDLEFDGAPFLYSWPSRGDVASYEQDQNSAAQAERYLRSFLNLVTERTNARHVHLVAHSMGNMPLLRVLQDVSLAAEVRSDLKIKQVILAAPDVDRDVFESLATEIVPMVDGVTLYASGNDRAMQASRAYAGGIPRAGDISEAGPIVIPGVDTIDVSAASTSVFSLNHSTYAEKSALLEDISALMLTGVRPPRKRSPTLHAVPEAANEPDYWKFLPIGE